MLLDVPAYRGVEMLPGGSAVTGAELAAVAKHQGVEIKSGDVVLVRTGWLRHWDDPAAYRGDLTGEPGPDASAAEWLAERKIRATGSDTIAYEAMEAGQVPLPVHVHLLVESGVHILEVLDLEELASDGVHEFGFVCSPLKMVGATASPVRPLALVERAPA